MRKAFVVAALAMVSACAQTASLGVSAGAHRVLSSDTGGTFVPFGANASLQLRGRWEFQPGFEIWQSGAVASVGSSRYTTGSVQFLRTGSPGSRAQLFGGGGLWFGRNTTHYPDAARGVFGPGASGGLDFRLSDGVGLRVGLRLIVLMPGIDAALGPVVSMSFRLK
jgi:hypothetical protein